MSAPEIHSKAIRVDPLHSLALFSIGLMIAAGLAYFLAPFIVFILGMGLFCGAVYLYAKKEH